MINSFKTPTKVKVETKVRSRDGLPSVICADCHDALNLSYRLSNLAVIKDARRRNQQQRRPAAAASPSASRSRPAAAASTSVLTPTSTTESTSTSTTESTSTSTVQKTIVKSELAHPMKAVKIFRKSQEETRRVTSQTQYTTRSVRLKEEVPDGESTAAPQETVVEVQQQDQMEFNSRSRAAARDQQHNTADTPARCNLCSREYKSQKRLAEHLHYHSPCDSWRYQCDECGEKFPVGTAKTQHKRYGHGRIRAFACDHTGCTRTFLTNGPLLRHKKMHRS